MTTLPDLEPAAVRAACMANFHPDAEPSATELTRMEKSIRAYLAARSTVPEAGKAVVWLPDPIGVNEIWQTVYDSPPTAKRHYLTREAAANAEARALIKRKYPSETPEPDVGFRGWHWSEDERLVRVHGRLTKRILHAGRTALEDKP